MVRNIREIEAALGDGVKRPAPSEWKNRDVVRRSLVATTAIKAGEVFTEENVTFKRPGTGVSPSAYWELLGQVSPRDFQADELLDG